jgi:antitoxin component YwqK of YwqJK toxin-antitoxin module
VTSAKLTESLRQFWVTPPPRFAGVWTTYYINGERYKETHYVDGEEFGESTAFRADGTKVYVQHYGPTGIDGEDTGYFPSGRIMYRAFYRNGSPVGIWTHYNEDGSVQTTTNHSAPNK